MSKLFESGLHGSYSWTDTLKGVYYGPGCVEEALPKLLSTLEGHRALIVTGKSLTEKTDVVRRIQKILEKGNAYAATFTEIGEHAPIAGIQRGVKAFLDNGCDIIVSVGGGSPIDAAKAILYLAQQTSGGPVLKQIAIPTTLSAAEYTVTAGFTDANGDKSGLASQDLAPAGVILDAELTLPTPERLWLCTGIRALDHAFENLYRPKVPDPIKQLMYSALADLFKYLPLSKNDPENVAIRQKLQIAAWMSLWPMKMEVQGPIGLSHPLGHRLGASYGIPHGITSCITLAPTIALKGEIASEEDKGYLSESLFYLRLSQSGSTQHDIQQLSTAIKNLVASLGLTSTLSQYGVPAEDLPNIAARSLGSADDPHFAKVLEMLKTL